MEQNQNQQQQFRCTGDCMKCNPLQRQYCAAQWSLNSMRMLEQMQQSISAMQGTIDEMRTKLDAIQGSEASLFDPTTDEAPVKPAEEAPKPSDVTASDAKPTAPLFPSAESAK